MKWIILSIITITLFYSGIAPKPKEPEIREIEKIKHKMIYVVCSYHEDCLKDGSIYYLVTHTKECGH